jgi:hypothetical protein
MPDQIKLKAPYILAKCCNARPGHVIVGYYSHNNHIKVHTHDCKSLSSTDSGRLLKLTWEAILAPAEFTPEADYAELDDLDFSVLGHHSAYGVDYAHVLARKLNMDKAEAFARHKKLLELGLLERVKPVIIQYRKGIVNNKWIKHRNHTYYDLTDKGRAYLEHFQKNAKSD